MFYHKASTAVCPQMNPCLNDGICLNSEPNFKCICKVDYHGVFCEKSRLIVCFSSFFFVVLSKKKYYF
jgi:hypothetical protein